MSKATKNRLSIQNLPQRHTLTITDKIFHFILESWFSENGAQLKKWLSNIDEIEYNFGTKEWADQNFNTHYACKHACWYCYAWSEAYQRKRDYCNDWGKKMTRRDYWKKGWNMRKNGYTIMYPTTHDILPEIKDDCFQAIKNMLKANINVLVVTKPHFEVIKSLVRTFARYKSGSPKIILRFTIGTNDNKSLSFWEPNAPKFQERFKALKLAYREGFDTSISMEPCFPAKVISEVSVIESFINLVQKLLPYVK
jgi:DNA repair photolyase